MCVVLCVRFSFSFAAILLPSTPTSLPFACHSQSRLCQAMKRDYVMVFKPISPAEQNTQPSDRAAFSRSNRKLAQGNEIFKLSLGLTRSVLWHVTGSKDEVLWITKCYDALSMAPSSSPCSAKFWLNSSELILDLNSGGEFTDSILLLLLFFWVFIPNSNVYLIVDTDEDYHQAAMQCRGKIDYEFSSKLLVAS